MSRRVALGAVLVSLVLFPARAWAQDVGVDLLAPAVDLEQVRPPVPVTEAPVSGRARLLPSLYVSTAVMQVLDVHSTLSAIGRGGVEGNPLVAPMTSHPAAFLAAKSAVAATTIVAAQRLSKHNKAAAVGLLIAINSAYALVVSHNYHVAGGR